MDLEMQAGRFKMANLMPRVVNKVSSPATSSTPSSTTDSDLHRRDRLPRKGHNFASKLNVDLIFEATQQHVSYTLNGNTLKGLDKYNDSTPYGIGERHEKKLLKLEVDRLVQAATSNDACLFDSEGQLSHTVKEGFEDMANLADQMKCAMGIIRLDNARISIQHCKSEIEDTVHNFRHARRRLRSRFNTDQSQVQGSGPKRLEPPARNEQLFHALVDFATASVARLLVRTAVSEYWGEQVLSCLAACTTKLKVLATDPQKFANDSIATAEAATEEMVNKSKDELLITVRPNPDDATKDVNTLETETDVSSLYHTEKTFFNKDVWSLLRRILYDVLLPETRKASASSFQNHATAYQAGVDGMPTTLASDRVGAISASADPFCVKNAYTALELVFKNFKAIQKNRQQRPSAAEIGTGSLSEATSIRCEWANAEPGAEPFTDDTETTNLDHVFSIVIPLSLSSTFTSIHLIPLVAMAGSETNDEDPILQFEQPPRNFRALFTVSTADFIAKEQSPDVRKYRDEDVTTLPQSPIRFGIRAGTNNFKSLQEGLHGHGLEIGEKQAERTQEYQKDKSRMTKWVISEDSMDIECRQYIYFVVLLTVVIVCGGIAIPFIARNRIAGVDPFQITLFSWILATFVIVTAKSRYAAEWPWHEFLHGHVICRSIKEVCDASGISPQTILMYLLLNEKKTVLRTRGPYNGIFSRQTPDSSGFTINEPTHISTMMASGLVVLKVLNAFGELLVCLDVRFDSDFISLLDVKERLIFEETEGRIDGRVAEGGAVVSDATGKGVLNGQDKQVKRLSRSNVRIDRVLGVYTRNTYFG